MTSPADVVMFDPRGSTIAAEFVSTHAPAKVTSRFRPDTEVPRLVMVAEPVTVTASPSAVPRSVVEAEAMEAEAMAFVLRTMAKPALI